MNQTITEDGDVVETGGLALLENSTAVSLTRDELDVQITTARQFPRNVKAVVSKITALATLDEETAQECLYALVRGKKKKKKKGNNAAEGDRENKPIEGPSIRLAEIAAQMY